MRNPSPYTFPHRSRKARADYLSSIGGYYSRDSGRYPIEFTVGTYYANGEKDHLLARLASEKGDSPYAADADPEVVRRYLACASCAYDELGDSLYSMALEDACRSLQDTDTYRMLYNADKTLDVTLGLHGRGGKHLVIEEFEGFQLKGLTEEDLYNGLMSQENENTGEVIVADKLKRAHKWVTSDKWVETFYRYVRQCEIDFTSIKASAEVEYQMLWALARRADDLYEELFTTDPDTGESSVLSALRTVANLLPAQGYAKELAILSAALGVSLDEVITRS